LQKIALTSVEKGFCGYRIEWIIMAENVIKNKENIILSTEVAPDLKSAPSNCPYILSHTLSRYDFKHVFVPLAADKCAEVRGVCHNPQRPHIVSLSYYLALRVLTQLGITTHATLQYTL
jgi:hypothetical protein